MRIALVAVCILTLAVARVTVASAADINVAGLIVDYGDGRVSYAWVPFEEEEISGVKLLERSGLDVVSVGFGGMGEAVCQIDDTGCPVDDCRKRVCQTSDPESPFWRYSQQAAPGEWSFAATGASGAKVRDGDIEAWSWTGTDANLPAISLDELATLAGADPSILEGATSAPEAVSRTVGGERDSGSGESNSMTNVIVGTGVVLGVAGFAIWRSRRVARAPR
jgi:hypothetical protein